MIEGVWCDCDHCIQVVGEGASQIIAQKDKQIAELKKTQDELVSDIEMYFSNDESLDRPICCSGSIQSECGCQGITGRAEIEYSLRNQAAELKKESK